MSHNKQIRNKSCVLLFIQNIKIY